MKRRICMVLTLVLLVAGLGFARGGREARVKEIVAQSLETYAECVSAGDAERWLALHEDEAYKMPQDMPMFTIESVREAQAKNMANAQAAYVVTMDIDPMEIDVSGDIAYAMGTYTIDFDPRADAPPNYVDGKFLTLYRRQDDGRWKIHLDSYSNNSAPGN